MLLTNYWNYVNIFGKSIPSISDYYIYANGIKFMDDPSHTYGLVYGLNGGSDATICQKASENYAIRYNLEICLGTGDTAVATSDDNLASEIPSATIPDLTSVISTGVDQTVLKLTAVISGTNASANAITIKELGIYKNVYTESIWSTDFRGLLFVRHVLQSPIVVQPSQGFSFAFEWVDQ